MFMALGWTQTASAKTVYLQPNQWTADNARLALYYWGNDGNGWSEFSPVAGGIYIASFDDATYSDGMIIVRLDPNQEIGWDAKWNQTANLAVPTSDNQLYSINGWDGISVGNGIVSNPMYAYTADFEKTISPTSDHRFSVDKDWKHIVDFSEDSYGDRYYMSYSWGTSYGVDDTNGLCAYAQYKNSKTLYDILVTPQVSGLVSIKVKDFNYSNSYPPYIQFYKVDETGKEYGEQITDVKYFDADGNEVTSLIRNSFVTAIVQVSEPTRVGIRVQGVYIDDFAAQSANVQPERKLSIVSADPSATNGTIYWNQQANGNVLVEYKVKVKNDGDITLATTDEDYSVSIFNRKTGDVYVTTPVPQALAVGETSDEFNVSVELPANTWANSYTYINMDLRENVSDNEVMRAQSQYKEYAPVFVFRKGGTTSTSNLSGDIAFGKVTEQTSMTFEVYNDGIAPLEVKSISVPEGFVTSETGNFTVAAKEYKSFTITLPVTTLGIFSGNLEIVYVDKTGADKTYTKAITGTVLDETKNLITFDDGNGNKAYPQGSVRYNTYISSEGSGSDTNYYLQGSGSNPLYITPLMTAEEGENIAFDAKNSSSSNGKVEVMISTDRQNWTTIQTVSDIASQYNWTTYTATIPAAGNYYIGFKLTSSKIDDIYGLVYAEAPEHDLLIVGSTIPATGTQNTDYTASVKVGNVGPNVETAGSYTATLYVDDEAVATSNAVDLPVAVISGNYNNGEEENYTVLSFTFKPHFTGEKPAYIEVTSGDAVVTTSVVNVNFAEEKVESDASLAGASTASRLTIVAPYYNHSGSESLLTATVLESMGVTNGAKIKRIYVNGYNTAGATTHALKAWVGNSSATELSSPFTAYDVDSNPEQLDLVIDEDHEFPVLGTYSDHQPLFVIDFDENNPFVYTGGSIRIIAKADIKTSYKNVNFEKSSVAGLCQAYSYDSGSLSYSATELPAFHFELVVEPKTLSGTVTTGTAPLAYGVEGATVTIRNDENDIEYFATTDADGNYSINVVRDQLTYTATVAADGYVTIEDATALSFTEANQTKNFTMNPVVLTLSDQVTFEPVAQKSAVYLKHSFKSGFNTLVLPFTLTAEQFAGLQQLVGANLKMYELIGYDETEGALEFDVATSLVADKPYILWASKDFEIDQLLLSVSPKLGAPAIFDISGEGASTLEFGDVKFIGSYEAQTLVEGTANHYGITTAGQIRPGGTGSYIKGQRAYLEIPEGQAAHMIVRFNDGGQATAIESARIVDLNGPVYDLNGRKMNTADGLKKGVYVVNGRKVIIK